MIELMQACIRWNKVDAQWSTRRWSSPTVAAMMQTVAHSIQMSRSLQTCWMFLQSRQLSPVRRFLLYCEKARAAAPFWLNAKAQLIWSWFETRKTEGARLWFRFCRSCFCQCRRRTGDLRNLVKLSWTLLWTRLRAMCTLGIIGR